MIMAGFIGRSIVSTVETLHITYSYCSVGYIQGNWKKFSDLISVSFLILHLKKVLCGMFWEWQCLAVRSGATRVPSRRAVRVVKSIFALKRVVEQWVRVVKEHLCRAANLCDCTLLVASQCLQNLQHKNSCDMHTLYRCAIGHLKCMLLCKLCK